MPRQRGLLALGWKVLICRLAFWVLILAVLGVSRHRNHYSGVSRAPSARPAAACSDCRFECPVPGPKRLSLTSTVVLNCLRWSGPEDSVW